MRFASTSRRSRSPIVDGAGQAVSGVRRSRIARSFFGPQFECAQRNAMIASAISAARTLVTGLTGWHFVRVPDGVAPETRRYYQQLTRFSSALAFCADVSMGTLGGALKRKEKLSARRSA